MNSVLENTFDGSGWAVFSEDHRHRYVVGRKFPRDVDAENPVPRRTLLGVLANPSIAGAYNDDPTLRKGIGFAKRLGFDSLIYVNLVSLIETDSKKLAARLADEYTVEDSIHNMNWIEEYVEESSEIFFAWGAIKGLGIYEEILTARSQDWGRKIFCFGRNKNDSPKHILYLPYSTPIEVLS